MLFGRNKKRLIENTLDMIEQEHIRIFNSSLYDKDLLYWY